MLIFIIVGVLLPALFFGLAWLSNWEMLPGGSSPTIADIWSIAGGVLGYWGVVFSGYAAYKVKGISERYFARTRFPQIKGNLDEITKEMGKAGGKTASALRSERFIASISVSLGEVERVPGHQMNSLITRAKGEKKELLDWMNSEDNRDELVNTHTGYWDLFRTLHEVSEEISSYIKEQGAK